VPAAALNFPNTPRRTPPGASSTEAQGVSPEWEAPKPAGEMGGYCSLCKVKHIICKAHADSQGHQSVVMALLAAGDPRVKAPRQFAN